jgi:S1-C subfamily serine protease
MFRCVLSLCVATALAGGSLRADDPKSDADTKVAAGAERELAAVEVKPEEKPLDDGRFIAAVKPGKATKVKMPEQALTLGFTGEAVKGGGVKVADKNARTALLAMRTEPGKEKGSGKWQADPGDIITHANGYAVNSFEDLLVAVSLAKNPKDVQIVIKDVDTGKPTIFYVTPLKRE